MPGTHTGDDEVFPVVFPADHVHEFILGIAGERNAIVDGKTVGVLETEIRLDNLRWVILPVHLDRHDEYTDFIWYLVVLNRVLRKRIEDGIEFLRILEGLAGEKAILFTGNIDDGLGGVRLDTGELDLRNEREVIAKTDIFISAA